MNDHVCTCGQAVDHNLEALGDVKLNALDDNARLVEVHLKAAYDELDKCANMTRGTPYESVWNHRRIQALNLLKRMHDGV